jgi:hypothetical protein
MELIEGTLSMMKVDGVSEVVVHLLKASMEIEDAWAALVRDHASSIIASTEQGQPRGTEGRME